MQQRIRRILMFLFPIVTFLIGLLLSPVLGFFLKPYNEQLGLTLHPENPELTVIIYGTLSNYSYGEYSIRVWSKANVTTIQDIYVIFNFDREILAIGDKDADGITNVDVNLGGWLHYDEDLVYSKLALSIGKMEPRGFYAFSVHMGAPLEYRIGPPIPGLDHTFRPILNVYNGSYSFNVIFSTPIRRTFNGLIPELQEPPVPPSPP